jgi:hypothetical protein
VPFRSEAERRFMHANHPEIAKRWEVEAETNDRPKTPLPERVKFEAGRRGGKTSRIQALAKSLVNRRR